jgi:hypothetical protein
MKDKHTVISVVLFQLVEAKIHDAFGSHKLYVNGKCLRVLRLLGQGGSAQVNHFLSYYELTPWF